MSSSNRFTGEIVRAGLLFLACLILIAPAAAAPPQINSFFPAGAQRGTSVEVAASGTLGTAPKFWVGGKGVSAEATASKGKLKVTVARDATPGVYWLRAYTAEGASALRPFIVGALPELVEKEPNDDFRKSQRVVQSCVVNGKLEKSGDVDCFEVQLKKGQTLIASVEAHAALRSPMDAMLQVLSADGFVLEENNDFHDLDPQIAFIAPKDGAFVVRVYAFPSQPDSSIHHFGSDACIYRLTLTTGGFADHARSLASSREADRIEVDGWNLTPMTRTLMLTRGDEPFGLGFGPDVANTVRVRREHHQVHPWSAGPFAPPFSTTGAIAAPGAEMITSITAKKGQTVSIQVESRTFGLAVNPVLRVLSADDKVLARAEPAKLNADTLQVFTFPADGVYKFGVSDLYRGGGPRHAFLLRVLSEPDYDLAVTTDRFALVPGKPTTIPVKVNRVRGFAKPVEVVPEGLPDGVKATVTRPEKPDPNTIVLSLSSEKPVNGPFRLVGRVKDEPALTRIALAPLAEFEESTSELWLAPSAPSAK